MKRILVLLIACLAVLLLFGCTPDTGTTPPEGGGGSVPPTEQKVIIYNGNDQTQFALAEGITSLVLPNAPQMNGATFIGWAYESDSGKTLYHAGAEFTDFPETGDLVFRAVGVRLNTAEAATPSLTEETLTFSASLYGEDYRTLVSILGAENVTVGMLIAPYANVTGGNRSFTLDCGAEGLLNRTFTPDASATSAYYTVTGTSDAIAPADMLEKLAGRAYLSCTFGGKTVVAYAAYYPLNHTCTLYGASAAAYEVLAASGADAALLAPLKARLDRVVNVSTTSGGSILQEYSLNNVDFFNFTYYHSPYTLSAVLANTPEGYTTYVVTGATPDAHQSIVAYFIGRSYRAPDPAEWKTDGLYIAVENPKA